MNEKKVKYHWLTGKRLTPITDSERLDEIIRLQKKSQIGFFKALVIGITFGLFN